MSSPWDFDFSNFDLSKLGQGGGGGDMPMPTQSASPDLQMAAPPPQPTGLLQGPPPALPPQGFLGVAPNGSTLGDRASQAINALGGPPGGQPQAQAPDPGAALRAQMQSQQAMLAQQQAAARARMMARGGR